MIRTVTVPAHRQGCFNGACSFSDASASLEQSIRISKDIELALAKFPEVKTTVAMIGRAEKGETADVNYMKIFTELNPEDEWGGAFENQRRSIMKYNKISAYIGRNRVADVVNALSEFGIEPIAVIDMHGSLTALDSVEQRYSV